MGSIFQLKIYSMSRIIGCNWGGVSIRNISMFSNTGDFRVAVFHRNKYHVDNRIFLGWDFDKIYIPYLVEYDFFGLQFSIQIYTMSRI